MTRRNPFVFAIALVFLMAVALLPYVWILLASFKARTDLISPVPKWFFEPTGINYSEILYKGFDAYLLNSIIIGFSSTALRSAAGGPPSGTVPLWMPVMLGSPSVLRQRQARPHPGQRRRAHGGIRAIRQAR